MAWEPLLYHAVQNEMLNRNQQHNIYMFRGVAWFTHHEDDYFFISVVWNLQTILKIDLFYPLIFFKKACWVSSPKTYYSIFCKILFATLQLTYVLMCNIQCNILRSLRNIFLCIIFFWAFCNPNFDLQLHVTCNNSRTKHKWSIDWNDWLHLNSFCHRFLFLFIEVGGI